jgi:outer membrane protein TolC
MENESNFLVDFFRRLELDRKKPIYRALFIGIILVSSPSWSQELKKELRLADCIVLSIKNNLDVTVGKFDPELSQLSVSVAREKFMPELNLNFSQQSLNSAAYSWIEAAEKVSTSYMEFSAKIGQFIPTGGRFSFYLGTYKNDTNAKFQTINPRYGSTFAFTLTQPLLKGFGFKATRKDIIIAQNKKEISEEEFRKILMDTIYDVEEAYWNLFLSLETLRVKQQSLQLAQDLLEKNKKEIEIGILAPREILSSQAEVAARKAEIIQAQARVKDYEDTLRTLLNFPTGEGSFEIILIDTPLFEKREVSLEETIHLASSYRPDLLRAKIELENRGIELGSARNELLPELNFSANFWGSGISGTQILYLDNNPLTGIVVGQIPGRTSNALKDALNFKYKNWSLYFTLNLPLNTLLSRAAVAQAKVNQRKAEAQLKALEQRALLEISQAVRAVETDYNRVRACQEARELTEQKLAVEENKLKAGLSTNFIVLLYQRDLAEARIAELKAVIDYNLSLSRLERVQGTSLEKWNIQIADILDRGNF